MQRLSERVQKLTDALVTSGCLTPAQVKELGCQFGELARRYLPEDRRVAFAEEVQAVVQRCLGNKGEAGAP